MPHVEIFHVDTESHAAKAWRREHETILAKLNLLPTESEGDGKLPVDSEVEKEGASSSTDPAGNASSLP